MVPRDLHTQHHHKIDFDLLVPNTVMSGSVQRQTLGSSALTWLISGREFSMSHYCHSSLELSVVDT